MCIIIRSQADFEMDMRSKCNTGHPNFANKITRMHLIPHRHGNFVHVPVKGEYALSVVWLGDLNDDEFAVKPSRFEASTADLFAIITASRLLIAPCRNYGTVTNGKEGSANGVTKLLAVVNVQITPFRGAVKIRPIRIRHAHIVRDRSPDDKVLHERTRSTRGHGCPSWGGP
jgi:hypothetical protein